MTTTAGYSGTPLAQKLGLRDGQRVLFIDLPADLAGLRKSGAFKEARSKTWKTWHDGVPGYDLIHAFTVSRLVLEDNAQALMDEIDRDGTIWISWPKKASRVPTDITEDVIREVVLPLGLVDVKVAAVSDVWSGLKLMIRKDLR